MPLAVRSVDTNTRERNARKSFMTWSRVSCGCEPVIHAAGQSCELKAAASASAANLSLQNTMHCEKAMSASSATSFTILALSCNAGFGGEALLLETTL